MYLNLLECLHWKRLNFCNHFEGGKEKEERRRQGENYDRSSWKPRRRRKVILEKGITRVNYCATALASSSSSTINFYSNYLTHSLARSHGNPLEAIGGQGKALALFFLPFQRRGGIATRYLYANKRGEVPVAVHASLLYNGHLSSLF